MVETQNFDDKILFGHHQSMPRLLLKDFKESDSTLLENIEELHTSLVLHEQ